MAAARNCSVKSCHHPRESRAALAGGLLQSSPDGGKEALRRLRFLSLHSRPPAPALASQAEPNGFDASPPRFTTQVSPPRTLVKSASRPSRTSPGKPSYILQGSPRVRQNHRDDLLTERRRTDA